MNKYQNCINACGDFEASTEHTGRCYDESSKCIYSLGKLHTYKYRKRQINNLSENVFSALKIVCEYDQEILQSPNADKP